MEGTVRRAGQAGDEVETGTQAERERAELLEALSRRDVIGQAKGVLMERYSIGQDAAFALLVRHSRSGNVRLRDLAAQVVRTRRLPQGDVEVAPGQDVAAELDRSVDAAGRVLLAHEAASLGVWELDTVTGVVTVDAGVAAMFGLDHADGVEGAAGAPVTTAAFFDRIHEQDRADAAEAMRSAIDVGGFLETPYRVVWPDGTHRHLLSRGKAVVDEATGRTTRLVGAITDVTDLHLQVEERTRDLRTRAGLVGVAQALGAAVTEAEVLDVAAGIGADLFGADGAVLTLRAPEDVPRVLATRPFRVVTTDFIDPGFRAELARMEVDFPSPAVHTARTGEALYLDDIAAVGALYPSVVPLYERAGRSGSASMPLRVGPRMLGSVAVAWRDAHAFTAEEQDLLASFAALCAQALDRVQARDAEQAAVRSVVSLAEALQRTSLSGPPQPDHLQIAVRYEPANEAAQIGGDWYDAFSVPAGDATCLVIGDVTGHDQTSAALMAQIRSVLRATVYALPPAPPGTLAPRPERTPAVPARGRSTSGRTRW